MYSPGSKVIVSNSTFSVRLGPEKSQLDSRSFFIYFFTIYLSNKLFMYSIKLNHFLLKNLLILTLQQVFLFVNSEITRTLNNIPISLFLFFPISLFPYFYFSLFPYFPIFLVFFSLNLSLKIFTLTYFSNPTRIKNSLLNQRFCYKLLTLSFYCIYRTSLL